MTAASSGPPTPSKRQEAADHSTASPIGPSPTEKLLLTPEAAGELLSVGRTAIYDLMAKGELQSVRIGRSRRVPVAALRAFVERLGLDD